MQFVKKQQPNITFWQILSGTRDHRNMVIITSERFFFSDTKFRNPLYKHHFKSDLGKVFFVTVDYDQHQGGDIFNQMKLSTGLATHKIASGTVVSVIP